MSGGQFDYIQYRFEDVAESIERILVADEGEYEPAIVSRFQLAADTARLAGKMIQRVDWLVSDDDGPGSFLDRWHADGLPVPPALTTASAEAEAKDAEIARLRSALNLAANRLGMCCINAIASGQERYRCEYGEWSDEARQALTDGSRDE